jgi:hypothetical protein
MIREQLEKARCAYVFRLNPRHSHLQPRYAVYTLGTEGVLRLLYPNSMDVRDEMLLAEIGFVRSNLRKYPPWHFAPMSRVGPLDEIEEGLQKVNPTILVYELNGRPG